MKYYSLSECVSIQRGLTFKKSDVVDNSNFRVLRSNNIDYETYSFIDKDFSYLNPNLEIEDKYFTKKNDIIICMSTGSKKHLGKTALVSSNSKYVVGGFLSKISANEEIINSKYLFYFLKNPKTIKLIHSSVSSMTINNLRKDVLNNLQIPVPSLQEQEKIVEKLDKVLNNVDLNRKNIEHTDFEIDKLFDSIIHEIFLQNEVRLGSLIELNYGKDLDKKERGDKFKIPLYGSNGIMDFASKPLHGDESVIVGRKGSVGELQYVEVPFWVIDVGFYVTLANKDHLMRYYYYLLKSLNLQNLATGVKPGLNRNKVYEILVPKHNLSQQKKIVDKLDKLFLLKHQMQNVSTKKTTSNSLLKRSILDKEFTYE